MRKTPKFLAVLAVCLMTAGLLLPAGTALAADDVKKDDGAASFHEQPSFDGFEAQYLQEANCTWTCLDGRTGSAEVLNAQQCVDACSGACGGPCALVE